MKRRELGKIRGSERKESQRVVSAEDVHPTFLDLAGSVDVPPKKKGMSWKAIKSAAWRHRATARK